ncbi:MarR family winged helix-turn-helix transcriptional regulator [Paraburkholderia ferrariae]|uniref:MarR family winged helix-turn-helix transcriptional regulator n=1 Tax=Paraburkholderia ferrariae TaxID=386056 RepID=UPI0004836327|nr:MarR family transcriptional regulator [Paraburkholderia ferrariae]
MPNTDHPVLEYLTFRIDRLSDLSKEAATQYYEREFGVSVRDLRVLRLVKLEPGLTLGRLIELAMLEKTFASKIVSSLVKRSLLRREIGQEDARQINLYLTPDAEVLVKRTYERGNALEKMMLSTITEQELEVLNRCIEKLTSSLAHHLAHQKEEALRHEHVE